MGKAVFQNTGIESVFSKKDPVRVSLAVAVRPFIMFYIDIKCIICRIGFKKSLSVSSFIICRKSKLLYDVMYKVQ